MCIQSISAVLLVIALLAGQCEASARSLLQTAYSSWKGENPGGNTDAFSPLGNAEAATVSKASGTYFAANNTKIVIASDRLPAPFSYGYAGSKSAETVASLTNGENNQIYGVQAIAMTYEGARAAAGSGTAYTLGTGTTSVAANRMSYAPGNSYGDHSKSAALTDKPGVSVAQTGSGYGPTALATSGGDVAAAFARSEHDVELTKPVVTVGHRDKGKEGPFGEVTGFPRHMNAAWGLRSSVLRGSRGSYMHG